MGGKPGGNFKIKSINKIHWILSVLFHVRDIGDTLYECNGLNSMHVGDVRDVLYCTSIRNCISHRYVDV